MRSTATLSRSRSATAGVRPSWSWSSSAACGGSVARQFIADPDQIPLSDGSVDAVVVQGVLEHVLDPGGVVSEIHFVPRADGLVRAETPFVQRLHAGAYDFVRFTNSGHHYLFRSLKEIDTGPVARPGTRLLSSVDQVVRGSLRSELAGIMTRAPFFWLRCLDRPVPPAFGMDNASAYYFLDCRSEREPRPRGIIAYYRGAQRVSPPGP